MFGGITAETQGYGIVLSVRFVLVSHLEASIGRVAIYIDKVQTVVSSVGQEPDLSGWGEELFIFQLVAWKEKIG